MSNKQILAEAWARFDAHILDPINASQIQRVETRRAFYAGALSLHTGIMNGISQADGVTEQDEALMEGLEQELAQFARDLAEGRA